MIGPICLLDGDHISIRDKAGWTLTQLTQCSLLGLTDTYLERVLIEADILNLLIDAATEGTHIIEEHLETMVPRWAEFLGIVKPPTPIPEQKHMILKPKGQLRVNPKIDSRMAVREALKETFQKPVNPKTFTETIQIEMKNTGTSCVFSSLKI